MRTTTGKSAAQRLTPTRTGLLAGLLAFGIATPVLAHGDHGNEVEITVSNGQRCIVSNGLPNHDTGQFPNSGNPNAISEQDIRLCVTTNPVKGASARPVGGSIGIALNGVQFRPGTADWYDPNSPRGFSRDRSSGWNLDGLGAGPLLGMDTNNAHVGPDGLYHYHGIPLPIVGESGSTLIGYAADGFEIHYAGDTQQSSYQLKQGARPNGPGGAYDGTYNEDWAYVAGSGTLDQCNGGTLNGTFVYFATDTYPFLPHCLWGEVSPDFRQGPGPANAAIGPGGNQPPGLQPRLRPGGRPGGQAFNNAGPGALQQGGARRGPPSEAIAACSGSAIGASCGFAAPGRQISGTCLATPDNVTACVPGGALRR